MRRENEPTLERSTSLQRRTSTSELGVGHNTTHQMLDPTLPNPAQEKKITFSLVRVSALNLLQCFDTIRWATGKMYVRIIVTKRLLIIFMMAAS